MSKSDLLAALTIDLWWAEAMQQNSWDWSAVWVGLHPYIADHIMITSQYIGYSVYGRWRPFIIGPPENFIQVGILDETTGFSVDEGKCRMMK